MSDHDLPPLPVLAPGIYRHFKGNLYDVMGVARHSESLEPQVVYRALYGERGLWVRPLSMFVEQIEREGRLQPRFAPVPEDEQGAHDTLIPEIKVPDHGS